MQINILKFQNDITAKAKTYQITGMDWQDITQEIYLQLWKVSSCFNPSKAGERTFIQRVATNKIRDLARKANAQKRFLDMHAISLEEEREKELNDYEYEQY